MGTKKKAIAKKSKAGRKPIADKAIPFLIYPRESWIKKLGRDAARKMATELLEREAKKKLKK
jgi:hypothetical protein